MQNVGLVQSLLMDINTDLMDNQGQVSADIQAEGGAFPRLSLPNLCLSFNNPDRMPGSISVCVAPQGTSLRLRAAVRESAIFWRDIELDQLETALRSALVWLMDQGVIEAWLR